MLHSQLTETYHAVSADCTENQYIQRASLFFQPASFWSHVCVQCTGENQYGFRVIKGLLRNLACRYVGFTCWDDINVIPSATSFANFMRSPDVSDLLIPCRLPYTRPPLLRLSLRRSFRSPLDRYSTMMYRGSNRKNYDLLFFFWSQTTNTTVCTRKLIYIKHTKIKVLFWWHHLRILLNQHFEEFDLWQLFIKLNWSFECWINIDKVRLNLTPC